MKTDLWNADFELWQVQLRALAKAFPIFIPGYLHVFVYLGRQRMIWPINQYYWQVSQYIFKSHSMMSSMSKQSFARFFIVNITVYFSTLSRQLETSLHLRFAAALVRTRILSALEAMEIIAAGSTPRHTQLLLQLGWWFRGWPSPKSVQLE